MRLAALLALLLLVVSAARVQSAPAGSHEATVQHSVQSQNITAADVRRVALASSAPGCAARKAAIESNGAVAQAIAAGVPVDTAYLATHPGMAAQVTGSLHDCDVDDTHHDQAALTLPQSWKPAAASISTCIAVLGRMRAKQSLSWSYGFMACRCV